MSRFSDCYENVSSKQKVRKFKDNERYSDHKDKKFDLQKQRKMKEDSKMYFADTSED